MPHDHLPVSGDVVEAASLETPKARDLAARLRDGDVTYARLVECRRSAGRETVVFDLDVEVSQKPSNDIRPTERISVTFDVDDELCPKVEALRRDFPRVPHLNLHRQEYPRDLCIFAEPYSEVRLTWTTPRFVHRVRAWLAQTAAGTLHQDDQPLEPLLINYAGDIMLPRDLSKEKVERLFVAMEPRVGAALPFYTATRERPEEAKGRGTVVSVHRGEARTHGVIHACPGTLHELVTIAGTAGIPLLDQLRELLQRLKEEDRRHLDDRLIVTLVLPRTRTDGGPEEREETWCFHLRGAIRDIGVQIGIWDVRGGTIARLLVPDPARTGAAVAVTVLRPTRRLTPVTAAAFSGLEGPSATAIAAVGVGALGSQVVMNAARSGFGTWTLIDADVLMPHNLVRHSLEGVFVGYEKAAATASQANTITGDPPRFAAICEGVATRGRQPEATAKALDAAAVILDMSASVEVARVLSTDLAATGRRVSLFLSPSGRDLVLLAEDTARRSKLDSLEMQYYRALLVDARLNGHLATPERRRYGNSCRDVTFTMPPERAALHAALGSAALRAALRTPDPTIAVWRSEESGTVDRIDAVPSRTVEVPAGAWTIVLDQGLISDLRARRAAKLPKETGGPLVGTFDMQRQRIYMAGFLPSPPDSKEWPAGYERGREGLPQARQRVADITDGMIDYVGEWHSHPARAAAVPSSRDRRLFTWLSNLMGRDGLPAVMLIVGDDALGCCVGLTAPECVTIKMEG